MTDRGRRLQYPPPPPDAFLKKRGDENQYPRYSPALGGGGRLPMTGA